MRVIQINSQGTDVKNWQLFLIGQNLLSDIADGKFGPKSKAATMLFQQISGLEPDGKVGNKTYGAAMVLGFDVVTDEREGKSGANFPERPNFPHLNSNAERERVFGKFKYKHKPLADNFENIEVLDNWAKENIIATDIPQLIAIKNSSKVYFHKSAAKQLKKLWQDWEDAGLIHLVLTWQGSYVPRFVRGSRSVLSNHAFGSAFDINAEWNGLKRVPSLAGQKGSVRELVPIAHKNGFYWGGHFSRLDGMHFEVAVLK